MTLRELERELGECGYTRVRIQCSHYIYQNCTGQFVVVALPHGRQHFDPGHVREIRKQVRTHRVAQDRHRGEHCNGTHGKQRRRW
jgi:predicted RNA binding protein YcfA (HicA-like mRNA interferase family)